MSFLSDKVACKQCGDLYDVDLLKDGSCRDCRMFESKLDNGYSCTNCGEVGPVCEYDE